MLTTLCLPVSLQLELWVPQALGPALGLAWAQGTMAFAPAPFKWVPVGRADIHSTRSSEILAWHE